MKNGIIKGEVMPALKRGKVRGRISLLAGSSLAAGLLFLAGGAPVLLAPTQALAANECGDPTANGAAADIFQCTDATTFTGISYPSTSGNLTLQLQNDVTVTTGGIVITPSGANTVTINRIVDTTPGSGDPQITSTSGPGISIIRSASNGAFTVDLSDNDRDDDPLSITGTTAGVYLSNSGTGAQTLRTTDGSITATAGVGVRLGTIGTGNITFTNASTVMGTTGAVLVAQGVNATLTNSGVLIGAVTFSNTGTTTFTNGNQTFGAGVWQAGGTMAMGSGTSTLVNNPIGTIVIDGTLAFTGLETFSNAGTLTFGVGADPSTTDGAANDRLVPGTNLAGDSDGVLVMDFVAGGADQTNCAAAVSADCLDLRGFSVTGFPENIVLNAVPGAGALADRIVLVDAEGGSLTATQFTLSADSPGYVTADDGARGIDTGLIAYTFLTDESADQVYLSASPGSLAAQLAHLPAATLTAWNLTTDAWFDRQADLHEDRADADADGGAWLRAVGSYADDDRPTTVGPFTYNTSYKQNSAALVGGVDMALAPGLIAGVTAGYIDSDLDFKAATDSHELKGYSVGAYTTYVVDGFFIDGVVNYATLDATSDAYAADGDAKAFGAEVEGGYRWAAGGGLAIEPLAALSYVHAEIGDIDLGAGQGASFDDLTSLRAGLGLRLSGDRDIGGLTTKFTFTGRVWQEFGDDAATTIDVGAEDANFTLEDDRDTLGDVALGVSVLGLADRLSLNLAAGLKFKEDYETGAVSIGARYAF